ncbi:MAG: 2-dehydro-3-deoxyphosphogluconate aldolase, partial [Clostridia bacterium]|nr:2-dehydro-3-deoxyphosphogluconate aldolase [Clostridia bacterium]
MTVMERLANSIVVPVVVLNKVEDAVPTARAMAAGGVDTMEITFRTACAPEAINAVADNCPEVLVGAGTIINVEQAKLAVEMGAKFIVSPGFSDEVVSWCVENG